MTVTTTPPWHRRRDAADRPGAPGASGTSPAAPAASGPGRLEVPGVTAARVLRSEWLKLRSLRSTTFLVTTVVLSIVGMGTFAAVGILVGQAPPSGPQGVDPLGGSLSGIGFTELLVGVLGVLTVTGEYASGMIRVSLTAVPRRIPVLVGKAVVAAAAVLVVTVPAALLAFLGARTVLAREGISLSLAEPGVLRAILGAGLYSAVLAVFGVAFGTLLRNTAGAVASLFGLMYVLPVVGILLPDLGTRLMPYLPGNAGGAILQVRPSDMLAPWTGFALFVGYAVVATVIAALVMRRRDA